MRWQCGSRSSPNQNVPECSIKKVNHSSICQVGFKLTFITSSSFFHSSHHSHLSPCPPIVSGDGSFCISSPPSAVDNDDGHIQVSQHVLIFFMIQEKLIKTFLGIKAWLRHFPPCFRHGATCSSTTWC